VIIAISGKMASGKTTLAKALAEEVGGTAVSFGDHVRAIAASQGRPFDRGTLQEIGQAAVEADATKFAVDTLDGSKLAAGAILVLEGLRHVSVRDALRDYARSIGSEIRFIYIETEEEQRTTRLRARGDSQEATAWHEAHASEADVRVRLRDEADLIAHRGEDAVVLARQIATRLLLKQDIVPCDYSLRCHTDISTEAPTPSD
jgi:cytidylate kinase